MRMDQTETRGRDFSPYKPTPLLLGEHTFSFYCLLEMVSQAGGETPKKAPNQHRAEESEEDWSR